MRWHKQFTPQSDRIGNRVSTIKHHPATFIGGKADHRHIVLYTANRYRNDSAKRGDMIKRAIHEYLDTLGDSASGVKVTRMQEPTPTNNWSEEDKTLWETWQYTMWSNVQSRIGRVAGGVE